MRFLVPLGPGSGVDITARLVGDALSKKWGQPVVIENRPGAAGTLGNEAVARADKDGYTLGMMTAGQIIAAVMNKSLRYDTLTAFEPVAQVATASLMIVTRPDFPANDVKALIEYAKANPSKVVPAIQFSAFSKQAQQPPGLLMVYRGGGLPAIKGGCASG